MNEKARSREGKASCRRAAGAFPQKVGSDSFSLRGRLQPSRKTERDFLRRGGACEAGERLRFTEIDIRQLQSITAAVSKAEHVNEKALFREGKASCHRAAGAFPQKVGSESFSLRGRLQPSRKTERDFLRRGGACEAGERLRFTEIDIRQLQSITAAVSKAEHVNEKARSREGKASCRRAAGAFPQKVGSESFSLRGRLQPSRKTERDFLRRGGACEAGERLRFTEIDIRQLQSITAAVSKAEHAPTKL